MKSYTEKQNNKPFDWNKFLNQPHISEKEWSDAAELSKSWVTCACGSQCYIIPRNDSGKPDDEILSYLGGDNGFHDAIRNENKEEALNFLELIEIRSAYLINQERENIREKLEQAIEDASLFNISVFID